MTTEITSNPAEILAEATMAAETQTIPYLELICFEARCLTDGDKFTDGDEMAEATIELTENEDAQVLILKAAKELGCGSEEEVENVYITLGNLVTNFLVANARVQRLRQTATERMQEALRKRH